MGYSDRIIGSTDTSALVRYDQIAEKWVYLLDRKFEQVRNTGGGGWSIASVHGMLQPTALVAEYAKSKYTRARDHVRKVRACEGLLMNMIAFLEKRKFPVWIEDSSDYARNETSDVGVHVHVWHDITQPLLN